MELKKDFNQQRKQQVKSIDFEDNNVISYCYSTKPNKSLALRKKNEQMQKLIHDQSVFSPERAKDMAYDPSSDVTHKRHVTEQRKIKERKQQEMEVKMYQET